ncbi:hypothetical protein TNCV_4076871 [Trichonephila clavipes]|nr:hypothetical protein TNCV_4076871 [Trichonephila clavipes]
MFEGNISIMAEYLKESPASAKQTDKLVFRSELIAFRRGLQCVAQLEDRFQEIWILTGSRASIQHLANLGDIGDQTSLDILSLLHDLSSGHMVAYRASTPQVQVQLPAWAKSTQTFFLTAVSLKMSTKLAWGLKHWESRCRLTTWSGHLLMHLSTQWSRILEWAQ